MPHVCSLMKLTVDLSFPSSFFFSGSSAGACCSATYFLLNQGCCDRLLLGAALQNEREEGCHDNKHEQNAPHASSGSRTCLLLNRLSGGHHVLLKKFCLSHLQREQVLLQLFGLLMFWSLDTSSGGSDIVVLVALEHACLLLGLLR